MKKEVLIAILIGFGLGLSITYGIYRVRLAMEDKPQTIEQIVNATPSPSPEVQALLAIHNPLDGTVQEEQTTKVAGTTIPNTLVVLFVNDQDYTQSSDETGNFAFEVELSTGSNVLITHVLNEKGSTITQEKTVIVTDLYSADRTATPSAEATKKTQDEA